MTETATAAAPSTDDIAHAKLTEEKRSTIGGSDAAAIVGLSPYKSAFDVWLRLTGRAPPEEDTDRFEMGRLLEEPIARRFSKKTGLTVREVPQIVHPRFPWATGHLDREIVEEEADLECKTVEWDPLGEWSDPNVGEVQRIPMSYYVQVAWYVMLRDYLRSHYVAAQFGFSSPLRVYHVRAADPQVQRIGANLLERCHEFWENHVLADVPPPLGASEGAEGWLKRTFPKATREEADVATDAEMELIRAVREARDASTAAEKTKKALENDLKRLVGDRTEILGRREGATFKARWSNVDPIEDVVTDHEAILREVLEAHNLELPVELIQKHSRTVTTRAGYRLLNVSVKGGK